MHSREELEAMKRADLQRLCKDHGIKANLKTESLIDHLLIASSPEQAPSPQPQYVPQPAHTQRAPSMRAVSRTHSSPTRSQSSSSVVIHSDGDQEMADADAKPSYAPTPLPIPATRTRKAKDTQLRLGVGRPTVAGGSGARAVTKPLSGGRSKRGMGSRSIRPSEDTIPEEELSSTSPAPRSIAGPSNQHENAHGPLVEERSPHASNSTDIGPTEETLRSLVELQVQPLIRSVTALHSELQQRNIAHRNEVNALNERIDGLTNEVQEYRRRAEAVDLLKATVEQLQAEFGRLRSRSVELSHEPMNLSTPVSIPSNSPPHPSDPGPIVYAEPSRPIRASRSSPIFEYPPPPARSPAKKPSKESSYHVLGKRPRPVDDVHISTLEAGRQGEPSAEELRKAVLRPSKKRARLEQDSTDDIHRAASPHPPVAGPSFTDIRSHDPLAAEPSAIQAIRPRGFSVFEGPEERSTTIPPPGPDDEVFTDRDFEFFDSAANFHPPRVGGHIRSTANAIENQPFPFIFTGVDQMPLTSTPTATVPIPSRSGSPVLNAFPFPEPPHSPSPAPTYGHHRNAAPRNDLLHPFGAPDGRAPSGSSSALPLDSGASLMRTPPPTIPDLLELEDSQERRKASTVELRPSNDVGAGLGMTAVPMRLGDTPSGPVPRTMYGTELQGDTRFGDFGVEGVASGFWAGGRF
ncbi:hypothetical protein OF83DRAFT_1171063 [Amylostereum chailletii]|nr:hypothetical protein OF83DRAFT_1171063 [Amylostereum chailletii]